MLLTEEEIQERIESPINLLNRLKSTLSKVTHHPSVPPRADEVITDLEEKIQSTTAKSKAANIMNACMDELSRRIPEVQKPEKLAQIATEMSKVISNHEARNNSNPQGSQIIVYAPQVQDISNYNIVEIPE